MVGRKIKELRLSAGATLKDLATYLGYSESFMSLVENGIRSLSQRDLERLAKYFVVDFSFFSSPVAGQHLRTESNARTNTVEGENIQKDFLEYLKKKKIL